MLGSSSSSWRVPFDAVKSTATDMFINQPSFRNSMKCEELNNNISMFDSVFQKITESLNYKLTDVFDKKEQQDTKIDQDRFGENIFINSIKNLDKVSLVSFRITDIQMRVQQCQFKSNIQPRNLCVNIL